MTESPMNAHSIASIAIRCYAARRQRMIVSQIVATGGAIFLGQDRELSAGIRVSAFG